jgi:hypothetical protein
MSTIKSSDEHLTLNADGSSKDIKFQANGVEKASISSAGAFTSTTIDATALTGDLPAISGASLTGLPQSFTGAVTATTDMVVQATSSSRKMFMGVSSDDLAIGNYSNSNATRNEHLKITSDGRGLSQFTAKAWCCWETEGTQSIKDSHNISAVSDQGVGQTLVQYSNSMANHPNYVVTSGLAAKSGSGVYYISIEDKIAGSVHIHVKHTNGSYYDFGDLNILIFGD